MLDLWKRLVSWRKLISLKKENDISTLKRIDVLDTHLDSDNLGDEIINYYCYNILKELNIDIDKKVPTHRNFNAKLREGRLKLVTGTNILGPRSLNKNSLWKIPDDIHNIVNAGLLGAGWVTYEDRTPRYTQLFLNKILSDSFVHSVRDSYTLNKMKTICPNKRVVNTACPTMWNLTKTHCDKIPVKKSNRVVTTITDYNQNEMDWKMIDILIDNYQDVYVWLQGDKDLKYLQNYPKFNLLKIIPNEFSEYNNFLEDNHVDYVGTRLHAGIHALNKYKRTIIISIDNRALDISKDTNLPIIKREDITSKLSTIINGNMHTEINLPVKNIKLWKNQFINF